MGVTVSNQRHSERSLFVSADLSESAGRLASDRALLTEFARYIKDGSWIDLLGDSDYFTTRTLTKRKCYPVTFYSNNVLPPSPLTNKIMRQNSTSIRSSSASTRDSYQGSVENFTEFYANIEERTCFAPDQMKSLLISLVYPFYCQTGERKALFQRDASTLIEECDTIPDTFPDTAESKNDLLHFQDIMLSTAAYFDEHEIQETLLTQEWIRVLEQAVNDCTLNVCICEVVSDEKSTAPLGSVRPVLINNVARKRIHSLNRSFKHKELDFLEMWSIESEDLLKKEVDQALRSATPLRLSSVYSTARFKTVLEITHIFDSHGKHKYVLGVQMDVPEDGRSSKHLQYIKDSSLLIAQIIRLDPGDHEKIPNSIGVHPL